MKFTNC